MLIIMVFKNIQDMIVVFGVIKKLYLSLKDSCFTIWTRSIYVFLQSNDFMKDKWIDLKNLYRNIFTNYANMCVKRKLTKKDGQVINKNKVKDMWLFILLLDGIV